MPEIEIKLQVPQGSRAALQRALLRGRVARVRLRAQYFDTPDRRLAAAGLVLRLRREGRRWVQAVKGAGDGPLMRLEHEVALGAGSAPPPIDIARHAGTPEGHALQAALDGRVHELAARFETDVQRMRREVRSAGARIELALDEGVLRAGDNTLPVLELELELLQGPLPALTAMAGTWVARHELWLDVRSKAERGAWLAAGRGAAPVAKAQAPVFDRADPPDTVLRACVRSAITQVAANASWLSAGSAQPEHLHQARVGLRRLSSVLREFGDWSGDVQPTWRDTTRAVFRRLSAARDRDALAAWLWPALRDAGAPPLKIMEIETSQIDMGAVFRDREVAAWLLELLAFAHGPAVITSAGANGEAHALALPVLARLHRKVHRAGRSFATLDDEARHSARKRLKRLRYGAQALSSLWPAKAWTAYEQRLRDAQDALGRLQDATVAEPLLQASAADDPQALFALGWLAGKRERFIEDAGRELAAIGKLPKFLR